MRTQGGVAVLHRGNFEVCELVCAYVRVRVRRTDTPLLLSRVSAIHCPDEMNKENEDVRITSNHVKVW